MRLIEDPYNLVITGVGGQGNVMASRLLGDLLTEAGLDVTIGETFGASQRGGSVMSHLRLSRRGLWSPQIPRGRAHLVIALEPTEALRVLADYGNPQVRVLCNRRPIHAISVLSGERDYPPLETIEESVAGLAKEAWFFDATETAMKLGHPVLANIVMIGAASALGLLPVDRERFAAAVTRAVSAEKTAVNLQAFETGVQMVAAGR